MVLIHIINHRSNNSITGINHHSKLIVTVVILLDKLPYKANSTQDSKLCILNILIMEALNEATIQEVIKDHQQHIEDQAKLTQANHIICILEEEIPNSLLSQEDQDNISHTIIKELNLDNINHMVIMAVEADHNTSIITLPVVMVHTEVVPRDIINLHKLNTITISELE